jgi:peptidoglycan/LPS O-acetylase OafA/YrhL
VTVEEPPPEDHLEHHLPTEGEPGYSPPPGHPRFPLFDSMRAIAALTVLVYHCGFISGAFGNDTYGPLLRHMNIGVVIFFVISGFLLYRPFVAERFGGAPPPRIPDYARRRALRILPGFWVALTVLAIYPDIPDVFSSNFWAYYGLVQIYPIYDAPLVCSGTLQFCGLPHMWSLAVEASFYLALPFYFLVLRRLSAGRPVLSVLRIELVAVAALALASLLVFRSESNNSWLGFGLPGTFIWFAFGMEMAVVSAWARDRVRVPLQDRPEVVWAIAAALYVLLTYVVLPTEPFVFYGTAKQLAERVLLGLIAALLVFPAAFGDPAKGLIRRALDLPAIAWLGLISYGIFLYHVSVAYKLTLEGTVNDLGIHAPFVGLVALTLLITIPVAAASYYLVERTAMRFK